MQRMAAQRALLKTVNHNIIKHTLMPLSGFASIRIMPPGGEITPINDEMLALVDRLKTKMRAYVEPTRSVLAQFDDENPTHLYANQLHSIAAARLASVNRG